MFKTGALGDNYLLEILLDHQLCRNLYSQTPIRFSSAVERGYFLPTAVPYPTPSIPCRSKIDPQDMDKTLHAVQIVSGVLQGPFDLGNKLLGMKGVMEMMVALCGSEREIDQLVAVEALIHASTKLSRATFIITNGVTLLKEIYKKTKNEKIKIRALVVRMQPCLYCLPHSAALSRTWERREVLGMRDGLRLFWGSNRRGLMSLSHWYVLFIFLRVSASWAQQEAQTMACGSLLRAPLRS